MPGEFRGSGRVSRDPKMVSSGVGTAWLRTRTVSLLMLLLCSIRDERSVHEGALLCALALPSPDDSGVLIRDRSNDSRCSSTTVFLGPFLFSVSSSTVRIPCLEMLRSNVSFRSPCSFAVMNVRLERIEVANGRSVVSITINMTSIDNLRVDMSVFDLPDMRRGGTYKATTAMRSWIQTTFALRPVRRLKPIMAATIAFMTTVAIQTGKLSRAIKNDTAAKKYPCICGLPF